MKYLKQKYHLTDKNITTSVQHSLIWETKALHYGFHLYDALGWDNLPWAGVTTKGVRFFLSFPKGDEKLVHLEIIFFRFMFRFCLIKRGLW